MAQQNSQDHQPQLDKKRKAAQTVLCPPERFINVATTDLQQAFQGRFQDDNYTAFAELCKLFEANSHLDFIAIGRRVKENFRLFSAAAKGALLPLKKGTALPSPEVLDKTELKFLEDFCNLLRTAHYRMLTQEEWETATEEEYTFNMPIEISWEYMDTQLLQRFWSGHPHLQTETADISERMLVFHRGIHTSKSRGLYVEDKIDLLMGYALVNPLAALAGSLLGWKAKEKAKAYSPLTSNNQQSKMADLSRGQGYHYTEQAHAEGVEHANAKAVRRVTLHRLMPDLGSTLSQLFTTLEIQEPTFTDLVILYRKSKSVLDRPGSDKDQLPNYSKEIAQRNIVVKSFSNIPLADLEMIFPEKKVYIKPFVLVQLIVTIVLAFITMFSTLWQSKISWAVMGSIASIAVARGAQVWSRAQLTRQQMQDAMVDSLYQKAADSQEGVLHTVLDEMCDQHTRETIIAYAVLLMRGESMTQEALDKRCEIWLDRMFGQRLDFAIENSLPVCLEDGIIKRDSQGLLSALPPTDALKILKNKWERHFDQQMSGGPDPKVLGAEPITQEQPYDMSITNENPAHDEEPEPQPIPAARGGSANTQGSLAQRRPAGYDQGPVQNTSGQYNAGSGQYSTGSGQYNATQYTPGQYGSGSGQYGSGSGQYSSGSGSYTPGIGHYDPILGRVITEADVAARGGPGVAQDASPRLPHAKFGAAPLLDSFSGSATTSNTARPASEASYRSESSYRPVDTVRQNSGGSSTYSVPGNGRPERSSNYAADHEAAEVKHPHLQKIVDKVPFIHHSNN